MNWLTKWRCWWHNHNYKFLTNIYGDEIHFCGGKRSKWRCIACGHIQLRKRLFDEKAIEVRDA